MNEFKCLHLPESFSRIRGEHLAYGVVSGYNVMIYFNQKTYQYTMVFGVSSDENPAELQQFLQEFASARKYVKYAGYAGGKVSLMFRPVGKMEKAKQQVAELFEGVTAYFVQHKYKETCAVCGRQKDAETEGQIPIGIYQWNSNFDIMCEECFQVRKNAVQSLPVKRTNLVAGIVGAVFGSLIGVALWVLIYQIGFIASISGVVMVVCAMKGFEIMGGRLNKPGVAITLILCMFMIFASEYLAIGIAIYKEYSAYYDISIIDGVRSVSAFLTDSITGQDLGRALTRELSMGYVFLVLAGFPYARAMFRNADNENVCQRIA